MVLATYREPLCLRRGVTPLRVVSSASLWPVPPRRALPLLHRSYGLMRPTKSLWLTPITLDQPVFAGCCEPLLGDGGSRRYLHSPCVGAWTPTPPRSTCALTRFLPGGHRPHQSLKRFGARKVPMTRLHHGGAISGLQSFLYVQAPTLARPPNRAHRERFYDLSGGWAVYTTQWTSGYPARTVASLHV